MSSPSTSSATTASQPFVALRSDLVPAFLLTASSAAEYIGLGVQSVALAHGAQAAAVGALTGLLTAVVGLIVVAFGGGTQPLVSGPRIAATVLMSELVGHLLASPATAQLGLYGVLSCAAFAVLCAGVTQLALAAIRGGSLVRMVPASVLSGLLFGSAILAIASQAHAVTRCAVDWPPTLLVIVSGVGAHFLWLAVAGWRSWPKGLSLFAALLGGTLAFYVVNWLSPATVACRTFGSVGFDLSMFGRFGALQWPTIVPKLNASTLAMLAVSGFVMGLIASLDTLIASGSVESDSHQRALPNRDLGVHGVANLLAALMGLLPVVGSLTRSKVAWSAGARTRWVSVLHAAMLLVLLLAGAHLLALLPKLAAAAVMIAMALDMIDDWSRQLVRLSLADSAPRRIVASATWTFVAVVVATVVTGQPGEGFGVGCVCAVFGLLKRPRHLDVSTQVVGERLVVSAQGALTSFFVDRKLVAPLLSRFADDAQCREVEFDLRRVVRIDASACKSLRQLSGLVAAKGIAVRYTLGAGHDAARATLLAFAVAAPNDIVVAA